MADKQWTEPMQWDNEGIAPSDTLVESGFKGGDKPPAGVFNYFLNKTSACVKELQSEVNAESKRIDTINTEIRPISKGGTGANSAAAALTNLGITASAEELNKIKGATDNIQTQLNSKAASSHTHTLDEVSETSSKKVMTAAERTKLSGIATGANKYVHPSHTAKSSGLYKVTVDASGHVSNATAVTKDDITALGIPAQDTNTTYNNATTSAAGLMSASDKSKLDAVPTSFVGQTNSVGGEIFNDYNNNTASGVSAHAEGAGTTAAGLAAHAEGGATNAKETCAHAGGRYTIANRNQYVIGRYNTESAGPPADSDTSGDIFIIGNGASDALRSNAFRITTAGAVYGKSSYKGSGADYAEMWEWEDGNPGNEDRRGYFVTVNENNKICIATPDDYILGVISATPVVVGDTQSEDWHDKYLKDVFGENLIEVVEVEETKDDRGNIIPAHVEKRYVLNPEYDPTKKYVSRDERKEWAAVGLMGKLVVIDDSTCVCGSYCKVAENGIATATPDKDGWRILKRLDENHVQILYK